MKQSVNKIRRSGDKLTPSVHDSIHIDEVTAFHAPVHVWLTPQKICFSPKMMNVSSSNRCAGQIRIPFPICLLW